MYEKPQVEVNWDKYESYPSRIKEFMMNPRAFTSRRRENLCRDFILSEKFMRDYQRYLDWIIISANQRLSEDFMRDFKLNLNWNLLTRHQKMSDEFVREMKDWIYWPGFPYRNIRSLDFYREFRDYIDWQQFSIYFPIEKLSTVFITEFNNEEWWKYYRFKGKLLPEKIQERFKEELKRYYEF